jgi:hypothetical protein
MVLITYHFKSSQTPGHEGFHYDVATSATDWIEAMEQLVFSGNAARSHGSHGATPSCGWGRSSATRLGSREATVRYSTCPMTFSWSI